MKRIYCLLIASIISISVFAQDLPKNWQNVDPFSDDYMGTSSNRAFNKVLRNKKGEKVIVAVIDAGVEIDHPFLKGKIWVNEKEIPNNKIDDDKNGYIDDVNGWDFIGGQNGTDVNFDTFESLRLYLKYKTQAQNPSFAKTNPVEYGIYVKAKKDYESKLELYTKHRDDYKKYVLCFDSIQNLAKNKDNVLKADVERFTTTNKDNLVIKSLLLLIMNSGAKFSEFREEFDESFKQFDEMVKYNLNPDFDSRPIVGDVYSDFKNRLYGNNEVEGPDADHGTHVAGIIAGIRNSESGAQGICENAQIMVLRAVPNGDERDKDIANAIRYAVDNGAKIINMSFGKPFSPEKNLVDEAVKYAISKDVLFVHAAGNDGLNLDKPENTFFPCAELLDNSNVKSSWIEVGAIASTGHPAEFSNYGATKVDLFAPGVSIYSSVPDAKFKSHDGTSMAAPVVAGIAALIRSYYPKLTAAEVKQAIIDGVFKSDVKVHVPGTKKKKKKFVKLCISGGIINAYQSVLLLEEKSGQ